MEYVEEYGDGIPGDKTNEESGPPNVYATSWSTFMGIRSPTIAPLLVSHGTASGLLRHGRRPT
eukprot:8765510-Pyramimonas_sp.AAC.1